MNTLSLRNKKQSSNNLASSSKSSLSNTNNADKENKEASNLNILKQVYNSQNMKKTFDPKKLNIKNYVITQKLENIEKEYPQNYEILYNAFNNPSEYLKEDIDFKCIIGKKSKKQLFATVMAKQRAANEVVENVSNKRVVSRKISTANASANESKMKNYKPLLSEESVNKSTHPTQQYYLSTDNSKHHFNNQYSISNNTLNNFHKSSTGLNRNRALVDNNFINSLYDEVESRKKRSKNSDIFKNVASESTKNPEGKLISLQNYNEMIKLFNNQERNIKKKVYNDQTNEAISKTISKAIKSRQDKLLMNASSERFRKKMEMMNKYEIDKTNRFGATSIGWQINLRKQKDDDKFKNKTIMNIGGISNPLTAIVTDMNKDLEIIRKPNLHNVKMSTITSNHCTLEDKNDKFIGKYNATHNGFGSIGSNLLSTAAQTKRLNDIMLNTDRFNTHSTKFFSLTKTTFKSQKEENLADLALIGTNLLQLEKDLALGIKGKKILFNNYEKDKMKEEVFLADYERVTHGTIKS